MRDLTSPQDHDPFIGLRFANPSCRTDRGHGEQFGSLGTGPFMRSVILLWDERYALLTVLIAAFGRAISEAGAVMIVGGNIDGFARVNTAIALVKRVVTKT